MRIEQLKYVCEIAREKSFSNVARKYYVSPQYVSKSIKQLEAELGVLIFRREKTGIFLTFEGNEVYEKARRIVEAWQTLDSVGMDEISLSSVEPKGKYLGYYSYGCFPEIKKLLTEMMHEYQGLSLDCFMGEDYSLLHQLAGGIIQPDFVAVNMEKGDIYFAEGLKNQYDMYTIFEDSIQLALGNHTKLLTEERERRGITLKELVNMPLAIYATNENENELMKQLLARHNVCPAVRVKSNDISLLIDTAKYGDCVILLEKRNRAAFQNSGLQIYPLVEKILIVQRLFIRKDKSADPFFQLLLQRLQTNNKTFRKLS